MRGGHNAKTNSELKNAGTYRKDRHESRLDLPVVTGMPEPPAHFDEEHKIKWVEVCEWLRESEIMSRPDYDAIVQYCEISITARRAYKAFLKGGMTVDTKQGIVINPAWKIYEQATARLKPLMEQFGFTPRARMSLKVEKKTEKKPDPFEALFGEIAKKSNQVKNA